MRNRRRPAEWAEARNLNLDIPCALLCLTGLALQFLIFRNAHFPVNDFTGFWIGANSSERPTCTTLALIWPCSSR